MAYGADDLSYQLSSDSPLAKVCPPLAGSEPLAIEAVRPGYLAEG